MKRPSPLTILSLLAAAAVPAVSAAPGYFREPATQQTPVTTQAKIKVAKEPYALGEAIVAGKHALGAPKLSEANAAAKKLRLASLQRLLPASGQKQIHPEIGARLTNREMNAVEYFVAVKFHKILNTPPPWAQQDPPIKIAY